jgi:hypothetical protein
MHPQKTVIISAGIGSWYDIGTDRLKGTLITHGCDADTQFWRNQWPPNGYERDCVYHIKAAAFEHAIGVGYRTIIWADASVTARKNPNPFIDLVRQKGYWLGQSGHNAAQTCSDACLAYFGVDRDWAQTVPDCATGLFGVNIDNPVAAEFIRLFIKAGREGAFRGSRKHDGQSKDPRFRFHRQDQSCATIIAAKLGMKLDTWITYCRFRWDTADTIFHCEGM